MGLVVVWPLEEEHSCVWENSGKWQPVSPWISQ